MTAFNQIFSGDYLGGFALLVLIVGYLKHETRGDTATKPYDWEQDEELASTR
jgi:hypothetical protein